MVCATTPLRRVHLCGLPLAAGISDYSKTRYHGCTVLPALPALLRSPHLQTHWVGLLVDRLGARVGDTLLLQKQHTDGEGVIHAEASLERGPQGESSGSDGGAQIAAAARAAVALAVALAPHPSASSFGSAWDSGNEVGQQSAEAEEAGEEEEEEGKEAAGVAHQGQQEGEEVDAAAGQQTPPAKRRRSGRHGAEDSAAAEVATASEGLSCRYCGRR